MDKWTRCFISITAVKKKKKKRWWNIRSTHEMFPWNCQMASSFAFRRSNVLGCWITSCSSTLLHPCQTDADCQQSDLPLSLSHSWLRSCSWWMPTSVPSIATKGRGKMWTSLKQKVQKLGLNTWPLLWHPNCWSCPLTLFERDLYWDPPPLHVASWGPPQAPGHSTPSTGKVTAAKTKRALFSLPIRENKPLLSFPAEGASWWRGWRVAGGGRGTGKARGSVCKRGQKPTETSMVDDGLSHTLHPIQSRSQLRYPRW